MGGGVGGRVDAMLGVGRGGGRRNFLRSLNHRTEPRKKLQLN